MRSDKALLMYCPFVARKCQGEKCLGWFIWDIDKQEGGCCIAHRARMDMSDDLDAIIKKGVS